MENNLIRLFSPLSTEFDSNGLGSLNDATKCVVKEELNGSYELEMTYPVSGYLYDKINIQYLIVTNTAPYAYGPSLSQAFRIYSISKPINGLVTINAAHVSYDLSGYILLPFPEQDHIVTNVTDLLSNINGRSVLGNSPFIFSSDDVIINKSLNYKHDVPSTIRSILGGQNNNIQSSLNCEYIFDNYKIAFVEKRGNNNGTVIEYGKNLTDVTQDETSSNIYTDMYPYYKKDDQIVIDLDNIDEHVPPNASDTVPNLDINGRLVHINDTQQITTKILAHNFTDKFSNIPSKAELLNAVDEFIKKSNLKDPTLSTKVSFIDLFNLKEFGILSILERVSIGDTIRVRYPMFGIESTSRCISIVYDAITDKYTSVALGDVKETLSSSISNTIDKTNNLPTKEESESAINNAIREATKLITGNAGGYVVFHNSSNPGEYSPIEPDEILIMDAPNIEDAVEVWRWNKGGLGHSKNGYNGNYSLAMTSDGQIVADAITAGKMHGSRITAGSITANEISVDYRNEIKNEINETVGTLESKFEIQNGKFESDISEISVLSRDNMNAIEKNSKAIQDVNGVLLSYSNKYYGGINLVRNSSGQDDPSNMWIKSGTGIVESISGADISDNMTAGHGFKLTSCSISQSFNTVVGKEYTISCICKNYASSNSYVSIKAPNNIIIFSVSSETGYEQYSKQFVSESSEVSITISSSGTCIVGDIIVTEGTSYSNWTPAANEMYTTNVKFDENGIRVSNSGSQTSTIIDNTKFAILKGEEEVLRVNGDRTILQKTDVENELTVGKGRFVLNPNGLDFILID